MDANYIRSLIFLVAGLIMIFFPRGVYRFQIFVLDRFPIKYNRNWDRRKYPLIGAVFITIAVILFLVAIIW